MCYSRVGASKLSVCVITNVEGTFIRKGEHSFEMGNIKSKRGTYIRKLEPQVNSPFKALK